MGWTRQATTETTSQAAVVPQYEVEVNKGSLNHLSLAGSLNKRAKQGWRLHTVFEQHGNTVIVYERWQ